MQWAVRHFSRAVQIHDAGGFEGDSLEAYKSSMALLQAMQSGHTSLEGGLERILEILGEEKPTGPSYHADLVRRVGRDLGGERPAILDARLVEAVDETRRFRHVARRNYNYFKVAEATKAIAAAGHIRDSLIPAIEAFREVIDVGDHKSDDSL